ncbi:hypothetical protein C8J57DRAFT_1728434 [Mycena rebaudengoi]|nr:hypothetical protein C8J57DRAFT_1728434 [Mycena rebaudengoi]
MFIIILLHRLSAMCRSAVTKVRRYHHLHRLFGTICDALLMLSSRLPMYVAYSSDRCEPVRDRRMLLIIVATAGTSAAQIK